MSQNAHGDFIAELHDPSSNQSLLTSDLMRMNVRLKGWVKHTDTALDQASPLAVSTSDTKFETTALTSITTFGPHDAAGAIVDLWDAAADKVKILKEGQLYRIRIKATIENTAAPSGDELLEIAFKEGGGSDLFRDSRFLAGASGVDQFLDIEGTINATAGMVTNGVEVFFKTVGATTTNVFDITILIEAV